MAHVGRVLGVLTLHRGGPPFGSGYFLLLGALRWNNLPLLGLLLLSLLLQVGEGSMPIVKGEGGEGGAKTLEHPWILTLSSSLRGGPSSLSFGSRPSLLPYPLSYRLDT